MKMTDKQLSPAAQAVLDAAFRAYDDEILYIATGEQHAGKIATAALREIVYQLKCFGITEKNILTIANELEGK